MGPPVPPPAEGRLFLIDGYAIIYRAFFALISRPLVTGHGENTSAAWGVATFLQRLLAAHKPAYVGWVHDSGLSFRHEQYPAYKATREKLSDELQADFDRGVERIEQLLGAYRIPVIRAEGYEADDVIGTLAQQGVAQGLNVVIVSGDKDFHQLVGPQVWLLNPGRGGPAGIDEHWVGLQNEAERLGVIAARVTDYLALVGDSSDNVPGVKGIGHKTAVTLIEEFGPLEEILKHRKDVTKKRTREALEQQEENARLSKSLVTIRTDLNLQLPLDEMRVRPPDRGRLRDLFVELEFHSMARSLEGEAEASDAKPTINTDAAYRTVRTSDELLALVNRIREQGRFTFDTETVLEEGAPRIVTPLRSKLVGISIATAPGEAWYLPFRHRGRADTPETALLEGTATQNLPPLQDEGMAVLRNVFEDGGVSKIAQNAKFDVLVLAGEGITTRGVLFDTMVASYILDPGRRSHALDTLALEFLNYRMISYEEVCGKGKHAIGFDEVPVDRATEYSCEDADITVRLATMFDEQIAQLGLGRLFRDIEMPLIPVLAEMEATGINIDLSVFDSLKSQLGSSRRTVEQAIYTSAGREFNINSNAQLRQILFEELKLPVVKRTSTGPSTDATVLERLADEGHELPALVMQYRELAKLESTYVDALPALVNPRTGRLHTSFNQTVAATGRLSSSDPNLQNIPVRTELGREIRRAFVPREDWVMLTADYSQIELRLLAHFSRDPAFVRTFEIGGDIHRETAALIFGVAADSVTSEMRNRAKTINFATIYGQGPHALSQQLHIPHGEAKQFIDEYFVRFPGVRSYLDASVEAARERGYAETIFGRRRYIPEMRDRNFNIRAFGERTAQNTPIQGSAADLIKIAMIRIAGRIEREDLEGAMLLQVHDELVFECPRGEVGALRELVRREMEGAAVLQVPLVVDVGAGPNWLEAKRA